MSFARGFVGVLVSVLWLLGCGGGEQETRPAQIEADPALAEQGESLMQSKGCVACHTMGGGRLVGPDLAAVAERRSDEFIVAMIVNPDSMLRNNDTARQMLAEYFTPMPNQAVTLAEAEALLAYFRQEGEEEEEEEGEEEEEKDEAGVER